MEPLAFIAKHYLNKAGRDLVSGYLADRDERRRTDNAENRFHFNKLSVRLQRLRIHGRLTEFSTIDPIGVFGALRSIGTVGAVAAADAINGSAGYDTALCSVSDKIPSGERWRFDKDGDIYSVIESILWGKSLKSPRSDGDKLMGAFILTEDLSSVKEVTVFGSLNGSAYDHEIVRFLINGKSHYKLTVGLHARLLWLDAARFRKPAIGSRA